MWILMEDDKKPFQDYTNQKERNIRPIKKKSFDVYTNQKERNIRPIKS